MCHRECRLDAGTLPLVASLTLMDTCTSSTAGAARMPIAESLGRFAATLRLDDVPPAVVARAKLCLLDFVGVTLAGARETAARPIGELVRGFGGLPEAAVWGFGYRAPAGLAALVNGSVGHHLELDDGHILGHVHPAATLIPAAFALVEPGYGSAQSRALLDTIASLEDLEDVNVLGRTLAAATPA